MSRFIAEFCGCVKGLPDAPCLEEVRDLVAAAQVAWAALLGPDGGRAEGVDEYLDALGGAIHRVQGLTAQDVTLGHAVDRLEWYRTLAEVLRDHGAKTALGLVESTRIALVNGQTLREILAHLPRSTEPSAKPFIISAGG